LIFAAEKCYNGCMTIKKPMKAPASDGAQVAELPSSDVPGLAVKASDGAAAAVAFYVGVVTALVLLATTFMLWQHWQFLMEN